MTNGDCDSNQQSSLILISEGQIVAALICSELVHNVFAQVIGSHWYRESVDPEQEGRYSFNASPLRQNVWKQKANILGINDILTLAIYENAVIKIINCQNRWDLWIKLTNKLIFNNFKVGLFFILFVI